MATRSTPARQSSGQKGSASARGPKTTKMPVPRNKSSAAVPETHLVWPVRMAVSFWQGFGHLVGGAIRRMGTDKSHMAAEERRDGSGLLFFLLAVLIATFEWWGLSGPVADGVRGVFQGTFGWFAALLPPMFLIFSVLVFRQPTNMSTNNRVALGFAIMTVAGCALAHVVAGNPDIAGGFEALSAAGGMVGALSGSLVAKLGSITAIIFFSIVAFASVLVLTNTPVRHIPDRLRGFTKNSWAPPRPRNRVVTGMIRVISTSTTISRRRRSHAVCAPARRRPRTPRKTQICWALKRSIPHS